MRPQSTAADSFNKCWRKSSGSFFLFLNHHVCVTGHVLQRIPYEFLMLERISQGRRIRLKPTSAADGVGGVKVGGGEIEKQKIFFFFFYVRDSGAHELAAGYFFKTKMKCDTEKSALQGKEG